MEKWIYKIEAPKLDNETCLFHETLFHNANGYLGVRSCPEEGYPPTMIRSGGALILMDFTTWWKSAMRRNCTVL